MFQPLNANKVGLVFGGLLGLWHLCWSLLVLLGLAQPFLDIVFRMHMLQPMLVVQPFSWIYALGLIVFTSLFGYVIGYVLSMLWNGVHECCKN